MTYPSTVAQFRSGTESCFRSAHPTIMRNVGMLLLACVLLMMSFHSAQSFARVPSHWVARKAVINSRALSCIRGGASDSNPGGPVRHVEDPGVLSALLSQAANTHKIVVIDFSATWCGPCQRIAPVFENLAKEYETQANFIKVDVDQAPDIAARYNVVSMPTFVFIKNNKVVERFSGARPEKIVELLNKLKE